MTDMTIALTRFAEPSWLVQETLASLARQSEVAAEVLFLDQQDDPEIAAHVAALGHGSIRFSYVRIPARSLSYARNRAVEMAKADIVLFIDSDAIADDDWAISLTRSLLDEGVGVVGGRILPKWHRRPLLIARARVVQEQYSLLDLGDDERLFPKVVGASFGIHKGRLGAQAYFDEELGRRNGILLGGEEVELCRRARDMGLSVVYNGRATVLHQILPERIRYSWILRRFYFGGMSRALVGGRPGTTHQSGPWDYMVLPIVLPPYLSGYLRATLSPLRP